MLIRCPKCETGFRLPLDRIPAKGAKLRCSACTHAFRVRIDADGQPQIVDPSRDESATDESTKFGLPARSKSAAADYDPFPLARTKTNPGDGNTTQTLGSMSSAGDDDEPESLDVDDIEFDDEISLELLEDDIDVISDVPQLATSEGPGTTHLAAAGRSMSRAGASDSQPIDLFADEDVAHVDASADLSDTFDPFGDAFDDSPLDSDVGLLRPSVPTLDERSSSPAAPLPTSPPLSAPLELSDDDFFLGGTPSADFGPAEAMVDPSFGKDVATFDPERGVVGNETPQSGPTAASRAEKRRPGAAAGTSGERRANRAPADAARPAQRSGERPRVAAHMSRPAGTSPIRKAFDVAFITLVVLVAFLGFTAWKAGGFLDLSRFGHMLEVAYSGKQFEPRPEWAREVMIEPPAPPPDVALRVENVRALEAPVGKAKYLVVLGEVRNVSRATYSNVELLATVTSDAGDELAKKRTLAGSRLDRKKLASAKNLDQAREAVVEASREVGPEGTIPFAVLFNDIDAEQIGVADFMVKLIPPET